MHTLVNAVRLEILALGVAAIASKCVEVVASIATGTSKDHIVG